MDGSIGRSMDGWICIYGYVDGWMDGWMDR